MKTIWLRPLADELVDGFQKYEVTDYARRAIDDSATPTQSSAPVCGEDESVRTQPSQEEFFDAAAVLLATANSPKARAERVATLLKRLFQYADPLTYAMMAPAPEKPVDVEALKCKVVDRFFSSPQPAPTQEKPTLREALDQFIAAVTEHPEEMVEMLRERGGINSDAEFESLIISAANIVENDPLGIAWYDALRRAWNERR